MSHFLYAVSVRLEIGLEANHWFGVPGMTSKELGEKAEVYSVLPLSYVSYKLVTGDKALINEL